MTSTVIRNLPNSAQPLDKTIDLILNFDPVNQAFWDNSPGNNYGEKIAYDLIDIIENNVYVFDNFEFYPDIDQLSFSKSIITNEHQFGKSTGEPLFKNSKPILFGSNGVNNTSTENNDANKFVANINLALANIPELIGYEEIKASITYKIWQISDSDFIKHFHSKMGV